LKSGEDLGKALELIRQAASDGRWVKIGGPISPKIVAGLDPIDAYLTLSQRKLQEALEFALNRPVIPFT
jgi:hypothetical protein